MVPRLAAPDLKGPILSRAGSVRHEGTRLLELTAFSMFAEFVTLAV